jgi:hypothetical protein
MAEVIFTAGKLVAGPVATSSPRKEAIRQVRSVIRNPQATDDEVEDALEALLELSKD